MPLRTTLLRDVIFKIVFCQPVILMAFLNAVLEHSGDRVILEVEVLNPQVSPREFLIEKVAILDVKAKDQAGRRYNIELQLQSESYYIERSLYYLSGLYREQLEPGESYAQLKRTVGISVLNFALFPTRQFAILDFASGKTMGLN